MRPDGIGGVYPLLPLRDRVLHRIDSRVSEQLSPSFFTGFYIGYAKDMNGESGALGGIEFAYEPVENLRIALSADYSNVADRSGQSGAYVHGGLSVTRTFAIEGGETDGR
jgi:hypothetical protein